MEPPTNPYRSPEVSGGSSHDSSPTPDSSSTRRSLVLVGLSMFLTVFVLFFACAGLFARIDSHEELVTTTVLDALVGVAIFALIMLNAKTPKPWSRPIPAIVVAVCCSGALISWHHFTWWVRMSANQQLRQRQEQVDSPDSRSVTETD